MSRCNNAHLIHTIYTIDMRSFSNKYPTISHYALIFMQKNPRKIHTVHNFSYTLYTKKATHGRALFHFAKPTNAPARHILDRTHSAAFEKFLARPAYIPKRTLEIKKNQSRTSGRRGTVWAPTRPFRSFRFSFGNLERQLLSLCFQALENPESFQTHGSH